MQKHLVIECQGYWHSDWNEKQVQRDRAKATYLSRYHPEYELIYVWEHEFKAKEYVLDRLKLKMGIEILTVDFDFKAISVKQIEYRTASEFLRVYHYLDRNRGGICIGASLGNLLIAVATFSPPVRQNQNALFDVKTFRELSRFCIHPFYHKKNFASWFLSRALNNINETVIAYADTTVGHNGTIYRASNFELHHEVDPDYWYISADGYVVGKKRMYTWAKKNNAIEAEIAERDGYIKKYGLKKLCFIYRK